MPEIWFNKSRRAANDTDYETWFEGTVVPTLNTADIGASRSTTVIAQAAGVRRLTPLECERLQGFPDGHTEFRAGVKGVEHQADSPRFRQLGNAVAVPVVEWILRRVVDVDGATR